MEAQRTPAPGSNLHHHFAELLESEKGADVTFLVSGESFAAHKNVLAARSPVFMAEFFGDMVEKDRRQVEVQDMDPAAFKAMLYFIYTDTVPELDQEDAVMMAQHLLAAADRYGLDRLKLLCENRLCDGISVDMVATTMTLAEQHGCPRLKAKCADFLVSAPAVLGAVLATEEFKHLESTCSLNLYDLLRAACARKRTPELQS